MYFKCIYSYAWTCQLDVTKMHLKYIWMYLKYILDVIWMYFIHGLWQNKMVLTGTFNFIRTGFFKRCKWEGGGGYFPLSPRQNLIHTTYANHPLKLGTLIASFSTVVDFLSENYRGSTGHRNSSYQRRNLQWGMLMMGLELATTLL